MRDSASAQPAGSQGLVRGAVLHHPRWGWVRLMHAAAHPKADWQVAPLQAYAGGPAEGLAPVCYVDGGLLRDTDAEGQPYEG